MSYIGWKGSLGGLVSRQPFREQRNGFIYCSSGLTLIVPYGSAFPPGPHPPHVSPGPLCTPFYASWLVATVVL
jgi:hypothetical protein